MKIFLILFCISIYKNWILETGNVVLESVDSQIQKFNKKVQKIRLKNTKKLQKFRNLENKLNFMKTIQ